MRPDWVWVPAHYVWTPRGYIFVGGYWDFSVTHRGVLFAPVFFPFGITIMPGFYFTPSYRVDLRVFSDCLFLRPRYHHYYFGDYYAPSYYRKGIYPWFSPHAKRYGYDPIYAHQRWENRHDRAWEKRLQATYQERRNYKAARPPRTLYDGRTPAVPLPKTTSRQIAPPFNPVQKSVKATARFQPLSQKERQQIDQRGKDVRHYVNTRQKVETQPPVKPSVKSPERTSPN